MDDLVDRVIKLEYDINNLKSEGKDYGKSILILVGLVTITLVGMICIAIYLFA